MTVDVDADRISQIATGIWSVDLRQRRQLFTREMRRIVAECTARGIGRSGAHIAIVSGACGDELHVRARLARNVLRKVVARAHADLDAAALNSIYDRMMEASNADVLLAMADTERLIPVSEAQSHRGALLSEFNSTVAQQKMELELVAVALKTSPSGSVTVQGHVFGAVQTGRNATASVAFGSGGPDWAQRNRERRVQIRRNGAGRPSGGGSGFEGRDSGNRRARVGSRARDRSRDRGRGDGARHDEGNGAADRAGPT